MHNDSGTELLASGSADKSSRIWKAHIGIKSEGTGLARCSVLFSLTQTSPLYFSTDYGSIPPAQVP